jgi:hypothetical protein
MSKTQPTNKLRKEKQAMFKLSKSLTTPISYHSKVELQIFRVALYLYALP